jgi:hypothetical protein
MSTATYEQREKEERRKERIALVRNVGLGLAATAAIAGGLWTAFAIDRVSDGNFGIGKSISGIYQDQVINQGFSINFLTKVLEVDGKNNIVQVSDIRPKDKDGVLLEDLDYNITYNVNPERAVSFLRSQRDMVLSDDGTYTLGKTYVTKFAQRVATEVIRDFASVSLLDNPAEVEAAIQTVLQDRLDKEYGQGLFEVANINIASVKVSDVIEQRIQNVAAQDAAAAAAQAQMRSLEKRGEAELAEAQSIKGISDRSGVSMEQLIEIRRIRALEALNASPQVTISADRKSNSPG